jgi:hypothetical protein
LGRTAQPIQKVASGSQKQANLRVDGTAKQRSQNSFGEMIRVGRFVQCVDDSDERDFAICELRKQIARGFRIEPRSRAQASQDLVAGTTTSMDEDVNAAAWWERVGWELICIRDLRPMFGAGEHRQPGEQSGFARARIAGDNSAAALT